MATPNVKARPAPLVVRREPQGGGESWFLLIAVLCSILINGGLLGGGYLLAKSTTSSEKKDTEAIVEDEDVVKSTAKTEKLPESNDPFTTTDEDPTRQEFHTDIKYDSERIAEISMPGLTDPSAQIGMPSGSPDALPTSMPLPLGVSGIGQGGAIAGPDPGNFALGPPGGSTRGLPAGGSIFGRSGATKKWALERGGGTGPSEAAVTRGLRWLVMNQRVDPKYGDGYWELGSHDIAGTAFGLLPLLGSGHTHKPKKGNPYDKPIEKALAFLMRKQDKKTGKFSGNMYEHGLATIAICEAYGLSQDPILRRPAQMGVNFIKSAQHSEGGWRYSPGQAGDTSVVGWQVMALKSAQMCGLDVPEAVMRKAQHFLDSVCDPGNEGYGYASRGSSNTMTAVGLLCRQYLQSWGPKNKRMIDAVENHLKRTPPPAGQPKNMYYYYYATQVMHHFGGQAWKEWNDKMREALIASQDKSGRVATDGSWDSTGDSHSAGRLMTTSLCLLTLEVYYRHLPLYYRDSGK